MRAGFRGAIFDVDGVLVDSPHERAWRDTLRELMQTRWSDIRSRTTYSPERFTPHVYQNVVAGRPRSSGARAALDHFNVPDAEIRAEVYAGRKQQLVVELIEAGEFTAFPDALRFVRALADRGVRIAAASSSKNAGLILAQIRLTRSPRSGTRLPAPAPPPLRERLRGGHLGPGLRARQARPGDLL